MEIVSTLCSSTYRCFLQKFGCRKEAGNPNETPEKKEKLEIEMREELLIGQRPRWRVFTAAIRCQMGDG